MYCKREVDIVTEFLMVVWVEECVVAVEVFFFFKQKTAYEM